MRQKKILLGLLILISVTGIIGFLMFAFSHEEDSTKEDTKGQETEVKKEPSAKEEPLDPVKVDNHNIATLNAQLREFVPLFYNAPYAKNSDKKIEDYMTSSFYGSTQSKKDGHEGYEDQDYAIQLSGISFYIPLMTDVSKETTVNVLTSFQTSIRSSGNPEVNRTMLVDLTVEYSDTWRVSKVTDRSEMMMGGNE
ncbi:hypothetical protein [Listeria booriae]|uniref:hypothetical protein n=1 Tax=Listeria booriae TaxID=1552123 RepID=UPI001E4EE742|nr:hypothetical protein [Listeria booriae]MCD2208587.1 hypothetical protein [Listeria booriae]